MPLKRSEVLEAARLAQEIICDFLGKHRDKVFSPEELAEVLEKEGPLSRQIGIVKKVRITRLVLDGLVLMRKVEKYHYQGGDYYGIAF